ncbi:endonuclease MutS2 [Fulvitalea axinellae]|uniref:Endonuclease MutS2 n=1 Tax=Fulvitalea axinellae TaxID=1182444 RepID=A0AAU9CTR1_9BACT|nr:endonuclease MutS2 [Fulvitalea axinellae]
MLYPKNIETKLGFDQIRQLLKDECLSSMGTAFIEKIKFSDDFDTVEKLLRQTEEFRTLLTSGESFPTNDFIDVRECMDKARIQGTFLTEEELHDLKLSLHTLSGCVLFFKENAEEYPLLASMSGGVNFDTTLSGQIEQKIDESGHLRSNASAALQKIRSQILSKQVHLRRMLDSVLRQAKASGITPEDVTLTIRDGRMVIPITATHKRRLKGFVHDQSATGQTVYMEPAEALEVNNEIRELEYEERREIIRILTALTDLVRPNIPDLKKAFGFLGTVDFIRAKAKFAIKIDACLPELVKGQIMEWHKTQHPLLLLAHRELGKSVVPLDITLNKEQRIILISGPNAGGKSVALKTVGLTQYMLQCGLLPPMLSHSKVGIFRDLFIDIGDEQSIENDLSTYSSHLTNMRHFLRFSDKRTLFLIDEFGTGTEPQVGGAIAEAILEHLNHAKSFGVINTHYANLKKVADKTPGIVNAAMRFDLDKLEPVYELSIGKPGSSFALEIATKIGLPRRVIGAAKNKAGYSQVRFDKLISELEHEKRKFEEQNKKLEKRDQRLKKTVNEYEELKDFVETKKRALINEAKEEAQGIIKSANREVEKTIRIIKERKAEKESSKKARQDLAEFQKTIKPEKGIRKPTKGKKSKPEEEIEVLGGEITVGSSVRIKGQETVAEVLSIKGKDAELSIGALTSWVKLNRLEKIGRRERRKKERKAEPTSSLSGFDINRKMSNFSPNLDLRGKRVEEVLSELIAFMDNASMFGYDEVRIVHGKGNGVLREYVRTELRGFPQVRSAADEHVDRGGAGVTVVKLK